MTCQSCRSQNGYYGYDMTHRNSPARKVYKKKKTKPKKTKAKKT
jgi:hypothetical protein